MTRCPLTFRPIFKERVWGGRKLEQLYRKKLPPNVPIGESWEITDRPEGVSVVASGPLAGKELRWLMEHRAAELLGPARSQAGRFPLLIKILDAREKLSLQVHPPEKIAAKFGGEPKTECWSKPKLGGSCHRMGPSFSRSASIPEAKKFARAVSTPRSFFM